MEISCTILQTKYHCARFTLLLCAPAEKKNTGAFTAITTQDLQLGRGAGVKLNGEWETHPTYGKQFRFSKWTLTAAANPSGTIRYLCLLPGIGEVKAGKLAKLYGADAYDKLLEDPEKIRNVLSGAYAEKAVLALQEEAETEQFDADARQKRKTKQFFMNIGLSEIKADAAIETFGFAPSARKRIASNPYRLTEIRGIGFLSADDIAKGLGIQNDNPFRIAAGLLYALQTSSENEGHVFLPEEDLAMAGRQLLNITDAQARDGIRRLIQTDKDNVVEEGGRIYLTPLYRAEKETAECVSKLLDSERFIKVRENAPDKIGGNYSDEQTRAILTAVSRKFSIITGGPGTGKTCITSEIVKIFQNRNKKIALCAPTGKAAKRMTEVIGVESKTIHRLLEVDYNGEFKRNQGNRLEANAIIIDEASMIDTRLMQSLLCAVPYNAQVVMVGDADQLPPVGPGSPFRDMISSGTVPVTRLTKTFRQEGDSRITQCARAINAGSYPFPEAKNKDMYIISLKKGEAEDSLSGLNERIRHSILKVVSESIPESFGFRQKDIQVLSPMKNGPIGTRELNTMLRDALNPAPKDREERKAKTLTTSDKREFRTGDRVMMTHNDYRKYVFNGEDGKVVSVGEAYNCQKGRREAYADILFTGHRTRTRFWAHEMQDIELSYAITVHKSQGSEYPVVVMPTSGSIPPMLLQRNLYYTAVTRAKKLMIFIGDPRSVIIAAKNNKISHRNSFLQERLQSLCGGMAPAA